jgi:hypothetical protein
MIEIGTKIHDKYSIEFKVGFLTRRKQKMNDFSLGMWIFLPDSLDIIRTTYPKEMFYQDVKSNIRLITPAYTLEEMAKVLENVRKAASDIAEFEYQVRMFGAIMKSAVRNAVHEILSSRGADATARTEAFLIDVEKIINEYVAVGSGLSGEFRKIFLRGDEFVCDITGRYLADLIYWLDINDLKEMRGKAAALYRRLSGHCKSMNYPQIKENAPENNRTYLHHFSMLKKYIESPLYLKVPKKRDGVFVEQLYLSIAAGVAMIVATGLSTLFQQQFGSMALLLFIAMVVCYMLKDRIKDLMRYYFTHKAGSKYFDKKAKIIHKDNELGWIKEGVDFVENGKVPLDVLDVRNSSHLTEVEDALANECTILYRKTVHINRESLQQGNDYSFEGINDIIRLNVMNFTRKMDNPVEQMETLGDEGKIQWISCSRVYYVNLVLQYQYDDVEEFKRFRAAISRDGIQSITEIKINS